MKRFLAAVLIALFIIPARAEDQVQTPLDPVAVVHQLYLLSDRERTSSARYIIWGDGAVTLGVDLSRNITVSGNGTTLNEALADLRRQSADLSATIVPQAERTKGLADSLVEGIKAILFSDRKSQ
jgi:hypothetical protein